jgi:hypothetical protein
LDVAVEVQPHDLGVAVDPPGDKLATPQHQNTTALTLNLTFDT